MSNPETPRTPRTQAQIDALLDAVEDVEVNDGQSAYPGLDYEDGIAACLRWLFDRDDQPYPLPDPCPEDADAETTTNPPETKLREYISVGYGETLTGYRLVDADMCVTIADMIGKGWEPWGNPISDRDGNVHQAFVRYADTEATTHA